MSATRRPFIIGGIAIVAVFLGIFVSQRCLSFGLRTGIWLEQCPDGDVHQVIIVNAGTLRRGAEAEITVSTVVLSPPPNADTAPRQTAITDFTPAISISGGKTELALVPKKGWRKTGASLTATFDFPALEDGEYQLHTAVTSAVEKSTLDTPFSFFAPARIHLITDRPLYEAGNTVQFRAVILRDRDLAPLENRPGLWTVTAPDGTVLLEEKMPSGAWGVVAGTFPLDRGAPTGMWTVQWASGGATGSRQFEVKPFTLPRFSVSTSTPRPFYRRLERPQLKGDVRYSSGAPVANATVECTWNVQGDWPPPTNWALPTTAKSAANGSFTMDLPQVPDDLRGQVTLSAQLSVVDPSGDRVGASGVVLLSEDAISVSSLTEFREGLVESFNNRMFLRASTADGQVLRGVTVHVRRLWDPTDRGVTAEADDDGVAMLQLDPGPPVNSIVPAMPFRPPKPVDKVTRQELFSVLEDDEGDSEVPLADRLAFDRIEPALNSCAQFTDDSSEESSVILNVAPTGAVVSSVFPQTIQGECMQRVFRSIQFSPGRERLLQTSYVFNDEDLPKLSFEVFGGPGENSSVAELLAKAATGARDCVPPTAKTGTLPIMLRWQLDPKAHQLALAWTHNDRPGATAYPEAMLSCLRARVTTIRTPKEASDESLAVEPMIGLAHVTVTAPERYEAERPQDTVRVGYEFLITAKAKSETIGTTKLFVNPGQLPDIRLRASSQRVKPGDSVRVEVLRGPNFSSELPKKITWSGSTGLIEANLDAETRSATFTVPEKAKGWATVQLYGSTLFFFIVPQATLSVAVAPEQPRYAPGNIARLVVNTTVNGAPGEAAVGLFGVDQSMSQLATLPAPTELNALTVTPSALPAFPGVDAQAIAFGRIRGNNAVAAAMLLVQSLPTDTSVEQPISVSGSTSFDANVTLVDRFYVALEELAAQVTKWEKNAPANEKLTPKKQASLWKDALAALEQRNVIVRDGWGRPLRLHRLPVDLLTQLEPRYFVIDGTHLPEDTENWVQWVAKEKP